MRTLLLLLALLTAIPVVAQPESKVARVGFLATDPPTAEPMRWFDAFRQGLREYSWEEGRNRIIESKRANGQYEQLDELASELVRSKVDVIVTDSTPAARAAIQATQTIPIVLALAGDPVGTGLVASLAYPGGNVTGLTLIHSEFSAKRLELLKELVPTTKRVAVLWNPENPSNAVALKDAHSAAKAQDVRLRYLELRAESDLKHALSTVASWRAHAVWVFDDPVTLQYTRQIALFALERRLPTLFPVRAYIDEGGGLLSYGPSFTEQCRRAAIFVDKILRGAKPRDLPVEQPTKFELVINLKTAKAVALSIPESILVRADEIINSSMVVRSDEVQRWSDVTLNMALQRSVQKRRFARAVARPPSAGVGRHGKSATLIDLRATVHGRVNRSRQRRRMLPCLLTMPGWRSALSPKYQLVICILAVALPLHAAQPVPVPRIGYLTLESAAAHVPYAAAFRQGLRERGYIEGQNISIEWRYAANERSKVAGLAAELVGLRVDVLVADGTQVALVAKRATSTIPIVVPTSVNPVESGLVASLARPGGNVTGFALMSPDLVGKRLALLKEVAPNTRRVAVLLNPDNPGCEAQLSAARAAAPALGLELYPVSVRLVQEIDAAFSALVGRADSVLITDDVLLDTFRAQIGRAAAQARLTSICGYPLPGDSGCLIMYGPDLVDLFPRAARLVDRILKGARPAELPVEQPVKFSLVINAKAAKAIGRTVPQSVLVRADEVID